MTRLRRSLPSVLVAALSLAALVGAADAETTRKSRPGEPWRNAARIPPADETPLNDSGAASGAASGAEAAAPAPKHLTELPKAPDAKPWERSSTAPAPSIGADGWKLLVGSVVLVVLLLVAARVVKRLPLGRLLPNAEGPIRVVARTHLGPKERLCLIEVGSTSILLALTAQGIRTLHVWPQGVTPVAGGAAPSTDRRGGPGSPSIPGQLRSLASRLGAGRP